MLSRAHTDQVITQNKIIRSRVTASARQSLFTNALSAVASSTTPKVSYSSNKLNKQVATKRAVDVASSKKKNPDALKFQVKETLFDMVNKSANDSVALQSFENASAPKGFDQQIDSKYLVKEQRSIQVRASVQKKVLNQQLNAIMDQIPSLNTPDIQESMSKRFQNVRDQTLSKSKIFAADVKQQSSYNPLKELSYKIEQSGILDTKEINGQYIDEQFSAGFMKPKHAQRFSRAGIAMNAHQGGGDQMPQPKKQSVTGVGAKSMLAMMIVSVFFMTAMPDAAFAARSGGRVGGRSFSAPRSAPRVAPRAAQSGGGRTIINNNYGGGYGGGRNVIMAGPSMGFGYSPFGFGGGFGYGGFGFGYNPALSLGLTLFDVSIREQQRQAYLQQQLATQRQLGQDQAQIAAIQQELNAQNQRMAIINAQAQSNPNQKYDENMQKQVETKVQKEMESKMEALQSEFKIDMDKGDFEGAMKVKQEAQLLLAQ